jgi:hypothetical protein
MKRAKAGLFHKALESQPRPRKGVEEVKPPFKSAKMPAPAHIRAKKIKAGVPHPPKIVKRMKIIK